MKKAIGFLNLHANPSLGKLTEGRTFGTVTFLGRYALMDLALSNFSNSDINKIEILVEGYYDSVRSHISNGNIWVSNTKTGFIRPVLNEKQLYSPNNTDIANIMENIPVSAISEDYVVVASPQFLMSIDYRDVLRQHGDSNSGITVVYTKTKEKDRFEGCDSIVIDKEGYVRRFNKGIDNEEEEVCVPVESYIFSKDVFIGMLRFSREISNTKTTIRKMVELYANNHMTAVKGYEFKGLVVPILSLRQYVDESFKLLSNKNRKQLFDPEWPVYTTTHNTPPARYGDNAVVNNCFVANGSYIKGTAKNCIISRDVVIEEGAVVEDCILFTNTYIGQRVSLKHTVTDKNVVINDVKKLSGDETDYLLISKGAKI